MYFYRKIQRTDSEIVLELTGAPQHPQTQQLSPLTSVQVLQIPLTEPPLPSPHPPTCTVSSPVQPVVGVFDLGARAFEGIRNASRMDDDMSPEDQHNAYAQQLQDERDRLDTSNNPNNHARTSGDFQGSSHGSYSSSTTSALSPPPSSTNAQRRSGGGGGGEGGVSLLAQRARPPRRFGRLGEMDPFTWDASVAQAILRAVTRDDGDVPSER